VLLKSPPHPGQGIKDDIDALGLSVAEAAEGLGVTRQQLHNVISGRSAVTSEVAVRLEKAIGSRADHWLRLQAAYDLAEVRARESEIVVRRLTPKLA
jgi:addiction module HigA family antidote